MAKMTVCFTLDPERDKRIVRWLDGLPKRGKSEAIRDALAVHLGQSEPTHQDILDAIEDLKRCGVAVASQDSGEHDDDPALAEALENLANLGL